jgi:hypothetical protein
MYDMHGYQRDGVTAKIADDNKQIFKLSVITHKFIFAV